MSFDRAKPGVLASQLFPPGSTQALHFVRSAWSLAVGPDLARRTEVLALDKGTLRIGVPDARWRLVLHRMQRQLIARLREVAGELAPRRIGFIENPAFGADEPLAAPAELPQPAATPPDAVCSAAYAIPDLELRTQFLEVAGRYLARFR